VTTAAAKGRLRSSRLTEPRSIAIFGIALGVLACWLALPPFTVRTVVWPILLGLIAALAGVAALSRGVRKVGWIAVTAGVLGAGLGVLALQSGTGNLNEVFGASIIASMLVFATPLTFGALGGMFSERSGVVNIALEGMMLTGAFFGIYGADKTGSWFLGILIAMLAGALMALVHAFFAIHLRADQIVGGMAINFLALGLTGYLFFKLYHGGNIPSDIPRIPALNRCTRFSLPPSIGPDTSCSPGHSFFADTIGNLNLLIWVALILVPLSYVVLFRTAIGLRIRACGEHPRAADTVGIDVYAVRYAAVITSGVLAALGGAFLSIGFVGTFNENMTAGRGFIALAALIFGNWRPFGAFGAALLFGLSTALAFRLPNAYPWADTYATLFQTLPYVLTLIAIAGVIGRTVPPAADGRPYKKQ
jgi:general nucleoside transport system permease protein